MKHIFGFVLLIVAGIQFSSAQYSWQSAFPGLPAFNYPTELVNAGDGTNRLFLTQQRGIIYVFNNSPSVSTRNVFLNISDSVSQSGSETGLLGLAFHPNYHNNGYFYVNHTNTVGGQLRSYVVRYQVSPTNPDSAIKSSRQVLLILNQPYSNHNGGHLAFGPDGYLYIGFGDGGSEQDPDHRGQDRTTLLSKILRINVDSTEPGYNYAIPPTNPFYRNHSGYKEETYAWGIRNPWKFSFDPVTRRLWLGDVGQDTREEVDTVVNGGNYGWSLTEGFICTPVVNPGCLDTAGLLKPVYDYPHASGNGSITGGYVYRGTAIPSLYGKYIFADYLTGRNWALSYDVSPATALQLSDEAYSISTLGVDENNEMYVCSYSSTAGRVYKLTGPATGVAPDPAPAMFSLGQNYPNPFNPTTVIRFSTGAPGHISLRVFDVLGREIATLQDGSLPAGSYTRTLDAHALSSGVYFYRLQGAGYLETKSMVVVK